MKYALLSILLLAAGCEADQQPAQTVSEPVAPPAKAAKDEAPVDYSRLRENLPGSQYYFPVHVFDVKFQTVKKAFEQRKDAYSAPVFSDGKRLTFRFDMTNPYDEPMRAPIPDYFRLQAACFNYGQGSHAANTTYNRTSKTYEFGSSRMTTAQGTELYKLPDAERAVTATYQLPFKPHQTRHFKVVFENPFQADCSAVTLLGFTKSDQAAGEQEYIGLVLDVATGEITDQQFRKRKDAFVPAE